MRLFAAVLPPEDVLAELAAVVAPLRKQGLAAGGDGGAGGDEGSGGSGASDGPRWTQRGGWHFTLAFYGEVPDEIVPELSARLERAAGRTAPFRIAVRGAGHFGRGAVLWAGADGEIAVLRRLAERAEAAGRRAGVSMAEHRRYQPHLTLAHGRGRADLRPYVADLDAFAGAAWTVDELCLVRSRLPAGGVPGEQPRYEQVGGWPLGRSG